MRLVDLSLAALGLLAVGLVLSSMPSVAASEASPVPDGGAPGHPTARAGAVPWSLDPGVIGVDGPVAPGPERVRTTGISAGSTQEEGDGPCCMNGRHTEPADAAGFLRRLLVPTGDSPGSERDRATFDTLLRVDGGLAPAPKNADEREVS